MRVTTIAILLFSFTISDTRGQDSGVVYPASTEIDHVDTYHGVEVPDPYRWLEDDVRTSADVANWVTEQNKVTFDFLESIENREQIRQRIEKLWNYEKFSAPTKSGGRYYSFRNDGLQNQSVLYVQDTLDSEPSVVIDPNTWSSDGTRALGSMAYSDDGRYLAYAVNESGSDWAIWYVRDLESDKVLPDEVAWVKFSGVIWTKHSEGFFYGRFDEPAEGSAFQNLTFNQKVYYHRVGTPQSRDVLVYERPDEPEWGFGLDVSSDGRYLILSVWRGTDDRNMVLYKDLQEPYGMPIELISDFEEEFTFIGSEGSLFYFKTKLDAPMGRVVAIDIRKPMHRREVVAERPESLRAINIVGNTFIGQYLKDARSQVLVFGLNGKFLREVELPGIGSASGFRGKRIDSESFYTFSSFATPPSIYRYDILTDQSHLLRTAKVDFDSSKYVTQQVFYESVDGTRIPMFITHKKGIKLDGNNRVLLYAYGGFNISMMPSFSVSRLAWMELGGVFAQANLRGGGEYGEAWHKAGTKLEKQNVFDDYISAAEWLVRNQYTKPSLLAIEGRSNGGLLIGAVMTQRPELFGVCLPAVGVMDMLRFHQFTAGRFWVDDYGSADNPEEFEALLAYSPYHNIQEGVDYPPTLVTTADTDDRVVPGHSFKFAARLQKAQAGEAPILIRIETKAGHGSGKPTSKRIDELADIYAFTLHHMRID
ncbi:MAG TPA: S9 family peptidase [Candidatus Hydrogenedentes bacterium]|nr:S9 family peptidase [Candidatus Hydrogenedentota bacterium]